MPWGAEGGDRGRTRQTASGPGGGAVPLANTDERGTASPHDRGVKLIFEHVSSIYGYRSLYQYKKKFAPAWEPRYLVFPRPDYLPRIAYALVRVHDSHR
jgi:phosphatidylglycerol lysyltransferase